MAFVQFKIDRSIDQSRGIFNKYIYETPDDTILQVEATDYFADCRFITIDGPQTNSQGWIGGLVECKCSDGYFLGEVQADGSTVIDISATAADAENIVEATLPYTLLGTEDTIELSGTDDLTMLEAANATKSVVVYAATGTITLVLQGGDTTNQATVTIGNSARYTPFTGEWITT